MKVWEEVMEMDNLWDQLMEMERQNESKGDPSLEILKESADSGKERIVSKNSEDRIEVPAESPERVSYHGEDGYSDYRGQ